MAKRYYVYLITDDKGKALYVGKGTGSRFMQHMQRDEFKDLRMLHTHVHFVADEASALQAERELVQHYGLDNLINIVMPTGAKTQKIRLDEPTKVSSQPFSKKRDQFFGVAKPEDVDSQTWEAFVHVRRMRRAPINEMVISRLRKESSKAGWTLQQSIEHCVFRGWGIFKADWVKASDHLNEWLPSTSGFTQPI